jgi:GNAT superfamily N-acetyltransferase
VGRDRNRQAVSRAFDNSALLVGAYHEGEQVGCCRVVTDLSRFAWLADVFVTPPHRQRGLARAMVRFVLEHPECLTITRFILATRDAHDVYASLGFAPPPDPQSLMQLRRELGAR